MAGTGISVEVNIDPSDKGGRHIKGQIEQGGTIPSFPVGEGRNVVSLAFTPEEATTFSRLLMEAAQSLLTQEMPQSPINEITSTKQIFPKPVVIAGKKYYSDASGEIIIEVDDPDAPVDLTWYKTGDRPQQIITSRKSEVRRVDNTTPANLNSISQVREFRQKEKEEISAESDNSDLLSEIYKDWQLAITPTEENMSLEQVISIERANLEFSEELIKWATKDGVSLTSETSKVKTSILSSLVSDGVFTFGGEAKPQTIKLGEIKDQRFEKTEELSEQQVTLLKELLGIVFDSADQRILTLNFEKVDEWRKSHEKDEDAKLVEKAAGAYVHAYYKEAFRHVDMKKLEPLSEEMRRYLLYVDGDKSKGERDKVTVMIFGDIAAGKGTTFDQIGAEPFGTGSDGMSGGEGRYRGYRSSFRGFDLAKGPGGVGFNPMLTLLTLPARIGFRQALDKAGRSNEPMYEDGTVRDEAQARLLFTGIPVEKVAACYITLEPATAIYRTLSRLTEKYIRRKKDDGTYELLSDTTRVEWAREDDLDSLSLSVKPLSAKTATEMIRKVFTSNGFEFTEQLANKQTNFEELQDKAAVKLYELAKKKRVMIRAGSRYAKYHETIPGIVEMLRSIFGIKAKTIDVDQLGREDVADAVLESLGPDFIPEVGREKIQKRLSEQKRTREGATIGIAKILTSAWQTDTGSFAEQVNGADRLAYKPNEFKEQPVIVVRMPKKDGATGTYNFALVRRVYKTRAGVHMEIIRPNGESLIIGPKNENFKWAPFGAISENIEGMQRLRSEILRGAAIRN